MIDVCKQCGSAIGHTLECPVWLHDQIMGLILENERLGKALRSHLNDEELEEEKKREASGRVGEYAYQVRLVEFENKFKEKIDELTPLIERVNGIRREMAEIYGNAERDIQKMPGSRQGKNKKYYQRLNKMRNWLPMLRIFWAQYLVASSRIGIFDKDNPLLE